MKNKISRLFLTALIIGFFVNGCAATKPPQSELVTGQCTWDGWKASAKWQSYDAADYMPDSTSVQKIKALANQNGVSFLLFGGSWCGDSKIGMPKVLKLMNAAGVPLEKLAIYGVDRLKKEETGTAERYKVLRVPTLIVLKGNAEKGRIIEVPEESWEKDLEKILEK